VWGVVQTRSGYPGHPVPLLALVSGGTVRQRRVPSRWQYIWPLAVVGDGPGDAWLSGLASDRMRRPQGTVLARWDGSSWRQVLPGPHHRGCAAGLAARTVTGVSAASPDYVIAVGGSWPNCYVAYVYNGHAWRPVRTRPGS